MTLVKINRLFAFSEENQKYFDIEFRDGANIIYGRNTSGKSTVILAILYCFGINDGAYLLRDIISEKVFFRADFTFTSGGKIDQISFVRDGEILVIKRRGFPANRFNGISGNNSAEHVKLKLFLSDLLGFKLNLEQKGELKQASLETMFLPYYVSQAVGWVYIRKSFSSLEYYKNFKEDYLDYYLGIELVADRNKRTILEKQLGEINTQISVISSFYKKNEDLQVAQLIDEEFITSSQKYIVTHNGRQSSLKKNENDIVLKSNELSYYQQRLSILKNVDRNHRQQRPEIAVCAYCNRNLKFDFAKTYEFHQDENDTGKEIEFSKARIKEIQSELNSLQRTADEERRIISNEFAILNQSSNRNVSYEGWLNTKVSVQLTKNIEQQLGQLTVEKGRIEDELSKLKSGNDMVAIKTQKENEFERIFSNYLEQLGVKELTERQYTRLYSISSFPFQGVELHKTVMAYHFAFNKLIKSTENIHRLPFLLDAIFKEDIEMHNREDILEFMSKNVPTDTQMIFSIAESELELGLVESYNKEYFNGNAHLINIGGSKQERALLGSYNSEDREYLHETLSILYDA